MTPTPPIFPLPSLPPVPRRGSAKYRRRVKLLERQGYVCYYCPKILTPDDSTIDHKIPIGRGGTDALNNTVACCNECNWLKSSLMSFDEAKEFCQKIMDFWRRVRDKKLL